MTRVTGASELKSAQGNYPVLFRWATVNIRTPRNAEEGSSKVKTRERASGETQLALKTEPLAEESRKLLEPAQGKKMASL